MNVGQGKRPGLSAPSLPRLRDEVAKVTGRAISSVGDRIY